jgi:hypothetical protein
MRKERDSLDIQLAALATREPSEGDHSDFLSDLREINRGHLSPESMVLPLWRFVREGLLADVPAPSRPSPSEAAKATCERCNPTVQEHGEEGRACPSTHKPAEAADRIAPAPAPICPICHVPTELCVDLNTYECENCGFVSPVGPSPPDCRYLIRWDVTCDLGTHGCGIVHEPDRCERDPLCTNIKGHNGYCTPPPAPAEAVSAEDALDGAEEVLRRIAASADMVLRAGEALSIVVELARLRAKCGEQ